MLFMCMCACGHTVFTMKAKLKVNKILCIGAVENDLIPSTDKITNIANQEVHDRFTIQSGEEFPEPTGSMHSDLWYAVRAGESSVFWCSGCATNEIHLCTLNAHDVASVQSSRCRFSYHVMVPCGCFGTALGKQRIRPNRNAE